MLEMLEVVMQEEVMAAARGRKNLSIESMFELKVKYFIRPPKWRVFLLH
jgi:hypothetical protein